MFKMDIAIAIGHWVALCITLSVQKGADVILSSYYEIITC